jgi:hypothetical protein
MKIELKPEFDRTNNAVTVAGAHMVIHCHHYNTHLLQTAHPEVASVEDKLKVAIEMSKTFGFGLVDFSEVTEEGGTVWAPSSHFATGWMAKWGHRQTPGCYFTAGYVAGALEAAYGKPLGYYKVAEEECLAVGAPKCRFTVEVK